jgi:hypothetical protein
MYKKKMFELEQSKLLLEAQIESSQGRPVSLND